MKKLILLLALALALANARGNDPAEPDAAAELAKFLFTVSDVIMDHELHAPPRQQLLHLSLHSFLEDSDLTRGLHHRVSEITKPDQLAILLRRVTMPLKELKNDEGTRQRLLAGLQSANRATGFGGATYQGAHDYKVAQQMNENRYVGIGIALGMTEGQRDVRPMVARLLGKGPAFYAGLLQGDRMLEIDGRDTKGKKLREVLLWLRGEEGSKVELLVTQGREESNRKIVITRSVVPITSAVGWSEATPGDHEYRIEEAPEFAYVRIDQITGATLNELQALEPQFARAGIKGIVLDLRTTNPTHGGSVHHACMLADGLIPGGKLGTLHEHGRPRVLKAGRDAVFRDLPMVALVGPATRGPAEWLAAALQDNDRAFVIGSPTAGVLKIRRSIPLPDYGGALFMNTARLERSDQVEREANRKKGLARKRGEPAVGIDSVYPDRLVAHADPRAVNSLVVRRACEHLRAKTR